MNAPTIIGSTALAAGATVALVVQEVAVAAGAPRSTEDILKIISAVGGLVVVIGSIITPIIYKILESRMKKVIEPVTTAVAEVHATAKEIGVKVDGTAHRMEAALATALKERDVALQANVDLRADKADQKEIILAQVTATPASATPLVPILEEIEANTDATAKNTAKTKAIVEKLEEKD